MSTLDAKITITAVDKVSAVMKSINNSINQISNATKTLNSAMADVGNATGRVVRDIRNVAFAVVGAGAALFGVAKKTASFSEEILIASQNAGVGVEALQKLRFAASHANISTQDLDNSLKFLNRSISDALTDPTSAAAAAFNSMNLSLLNTDGTVKSTNTVLEEMSDKFKNAADGPRKVATAMTLMGRSGSESIAFLNQGSKAMREQQEQATKLGFVMTKEILEKNAKFEQEYKNLTFSIGGLVSMIGTELIPVLMPVIKGMLVWMKTNKLWVSGKISEAVVQLAQGLKEVWKHLIMIRDFLAPVINALGGFKTIIIALASLYILRFIVGVGKLVAAIFTLGKAFVALSAAILASPITWIIVGLVALGAAIYLIIKNWGKVKEAMRSVWAYAKPFIEGLLNIITFGMYSIVKMIVANWDEITAYLQGAWQFIADMASYVFNLVFGYVKAGFDPILPYIQAAWDGIVSFFTAGLEKLLGLFGTNLESVKKSVIEFTDAIIAPFKNLYDYISSVFTKIVELKNSIFGGDEDITQKINVVPEVMKSNLQDLSAVDGAQQNLATAGRKILPLFTQTAQAMQQGQAPAANVPMAESVSDVPKKLDIFMTIDYEGRPTKVTAKSPTTPINFAASVGKMV